MRHFLIALLLACSLASAGPTQQALVSLAPGGGGGGGGFTLVNHLTYSPNGGSATTSPDIDTTGATVIVIFVGAYEGWPATAMADSKGNTWQARPDNNGSDQSGRFFYCINPTVGANHNFTPTVAAAIYTFVGVLTFSGAGTATYHSENAALPVSSALQPGAVTPAVNGALVVSGVFAYGIGGSPTINSSFTGYGVAKSGNIGMGGIAYLVQGTAAAINPTWTSAGHSGEAAVNILDFAP